MNWDLAVSVGMDGVLSASTRKNRCQPDSKHRRKYVVTKHPRLRRPLIDNTCKFERFKYCWRSPGRVSSYVIGGSLQDKVAFRSGTWAIRSKFSTIYRCGFARVE